MDTLHVILALEPKKKLKVQQLNIKGAHLNGILKEKLHMKQPEGFKDDTDWVCKTIYGLKQAGHKWNKQLDEKLRQHGYKHLISDPCIYVWWEGDCIAIITVWVDDLMLFASSDAMMEHMKNTIKSEWEVTDLGKPRQIIGIKITIDNDSISISQQKCIESLLKQEGMENANLVGMPLDPHANLFQILKTMNPIAATPSLNYSVICNIWETTRDQIYYMHSI
jgi:hypothetical protein